MTELGGALDSLLGKVKADSRKENIQELLKSLDKADLYLPAILPPNTDPALMKQMAESRGRNLPIPKGVSPEPAIIENKEGNKFLPVFTSQEHMKGDKSNLTYPVVLGMPFRACVELLKKKTHLKGIVVNPFHQNVILSGFAKEAESETVTLTEPQYHAVVRQQVEATILPAALFEQKGTLIEDLSERGGECLMEFYQSPYEQTGTCPYSAGDFEVMALNIKEDLTILRVAMPEDNIVPGTCPTVLITWNPLKEQVGYYGVVKGKKEDANHIMEAFEDGSKRDLGVAPEEGNELNYMISFLEKQGK